MHMQCVMSIGAAQSCIQIVYDGVRHRHFVNILTLPCYRHFALKRLVLAVSLGHSVNSPLSSPVSSTVEVSAGENFLGFAESRNHDPLNNYEPVCSTVQVIDGVRHKKPPEIVFFETRSNLQGGSPYYSHFFLSLLIVNEFTYFVNSACVSYDTITDISRFILN